jgi:large subunit ribosomal protein L21
MKKAVITSGGKQYLVTEGDELEVDLLSDTEKKLTFESLLIVDGDSTKVGNPVVNGVTVTAEVVEAEVKGDKVIAIRYKPKKRVHKVRGHRQRYTRIKINKIA